MTDLTTVDVIDDLLPEATRRLVRTTDALPDSAYAEASSLPGWTRGHVLAHLALNAEALAGALRGVVEGRKVPMYASDEARDGDIEDLAAEPPEVVRARLLAACTELKDAIDAVPDDQQDTTMERNPGGRTFPVGAVPWMRLGEVEIHHADLDAGYDHRRWSVPFASDILEARRARLDASSGFTAYASDIDRSWTYGEGGPTVTGSVVDLAWWLTGRGDGEGLTSDGELPRIEGY
ncbi:maleylpyruvate isomerase family mycothiol-dependent enzyme [Nocardioides sp. MAH-18]|uniref:Maleylpyruvate isomerase family mycothiol-dependent enzyme n=1 Tax=Nocardioides agri TaxID=2682843 RepID=A0A6L6Y382_9ACTN|nr:MULTISPECIES: maleylpyruvate isomerase family mycothiol-dependent enzyme [unclassified Nocardioides]MBA2952883.1 maleylpyruvate isomerase family mycothiol-dependent enzyme [Nocardioides sp. CGMCC 1.13656]MVQ52045.1 maleylpyruvate isomerase family mycothiol-dependent enzyme [Nocardioides sp. MAH-18]